MPVYELDGIRPELPPAGTFWIAPSAQVMGRVRLAEGVSIWFGAVLRGDTELIDIRRGSNVQDGAVLHTDPGFPLTLGEGSTIGHRAVVHGCTIGPNSLIGMGAVVLNGARFGANCLVGAGAVVPEGREFPDNSLIVGAPGKLIRTLDDAGAAQIGRPAAFYEKNWRLFASTLVPLD